MKRIVLFALFLMLGYLSNAQSFTIEGITYAATSDSTCEVRGSTLTDCIIPPFVVHDSVTYKVTSIWGRSGTGTSSNQGAFRNNQTIHSIEIPYTIESISFYAFYRCTSLSSVYYNAKEINSNSTLLTAIFSDCPNITSVTIGDSVKTIPAYFMYGQTNLTDLIMSDNVEHIGINAFYGCIGLSYLTLPDKLRTIGGSAFLGCSGLFSVVIPDSVRTIESDAFAYCSNLYSLSIGQNVETIWSTAFRNCSFLHNVIYNARSASYMSNNSMFGNCDSISNLTFGSNVRSIPTYFMNSKPNLHQVVFPEGLTHISNNAFNNCGIEELVIPSTVTNIGQNAFSNNIYINRIISLAVIPPAIYGSTFSAVPTNAEIVVPCGSSSEYNIRPWWNVMTNVKETCRHATINDTICNGEVYEYGSHSTTVSGTYYDTIHIDQYVDSMTTIHLVVIPTYDYTHTEQICSGQTYSSYGFSEYENGMYVHSLQSMNGCDSIVRLNLTVNPIYDTTITASICQGNTYTQYGFNTTMEGSHTQNLYTIAGCDSVVHLQLAVNPTYSEQLSDTITNVQGYQFVDTTLTQSGVYQRTLHTLAGCDSLLTLTLTVIPSVDTLIVHDTVLYPDTVIVVDTLIVYIDTLVIHDTITPCPVYRTYIHATIEQGEAYMDYGFNVSTPGVYCDTLQTTEGCDSIVCLYLTQTVGIGEVTNTRMFSIFPNPANSTIHLSVPEGSGCGLINIVDNTGKIVITQTISERENIIDVSALPVGIYYVRIGEMTSKLIIR